MNILYLAHSYIPSFSANSIQVMNMCQAFQKKHNITLLAQYSDDILKDKNYVFEFYGISEYFEILKSFNTPSRSLNSILNYFFLIKILNQRKIDLCFGRHLKRICLAGYLGLPIALETHDLPKNKQEALLFKSVCKQKKFTSLICISELLKKRYLELFPELKKKNIIVAHAGVNLEYIDRVSPKNINIFGSKQSFKVGYVGGLNPEKGIDLIIRTAELSPDIEFHLVGGSDSELDFWKKKAKYLPNVVFYGQVNPVEAIQYRKLFDVLLSPYQQLNWNKKYNDIVRDEQKIIINSPIKYKEYMATEKPIITSDIPIAREVFSHGEDALLLPEDPAIWAEWIRELQNNPGLRKKLSRNARLKVQEQTWEKRAEKILGELGLTT